MWPALAVLAPSNVFVILGFGSAFDGTAGPLSDVDLAVLLDGPLGCNEEQGLRSSVAEVLPEWISSC